MDAGLLSALQQPSFVKATFIRIALASGAVCLTDGGESEYNGETYHGRHPVHGVLSSVGSIKDGAQSETTRIEITILPDDAPSAAQFGAPTNQGARVQWWEAVIDPVTGGLIGVPLLKFDGEIDKPRLSVGESWAVTLECGTQAERQLEENADWRLNHAFHSKVWPGDLGLVNVTNIEKKIYWRQSAPNGSFLTGSASAFFGGSGGSSSF